MVYPVIPMVKPTNLALATNGNLPPSVLMVPGWVDGSADGKSAAQCHVTAIRAFNAFDAKVLELFGEIMTVTSSADGYRTYTQQYNTFMKRYTTDYLPGRPTKRCFGKTWYLKPGYAGSACPGSSNHGWALARDTCYWRGRIVGITSNGTAFNWMLANAHLYGLSWESQSEPWHIRYNTGDAIPQAVLDYEAGGPYMISAERKDVFKGNPSPDVDMSRHAQRRLNDKGADPPLVEDGQFGTKSDTAAKAFQTSLGMTADGKIGPKTWTELEKVP